MDYTTLSLADVKTGLDAIARDAEATFGSLNARQLNWKPDAARWSVGQCFEHLLTANRLMLGAAEDALNPARPRSIWQRLPGVPGVIGRLMVRSQAPEATRKFKAPAPARPTSSDIAADVIQRFVEQHRDAVARVAALDDQRRRLRVDRLERMQPPAPRHDLVDDLLRDAARMLHRGSL